MPDDVTLLPSIVAPKVRANPPVNTANTLRVVTEPGTPISQIIRANGTFLEIGDWAKLQVKGMEQLVVTPGA